MFRHLRGAYRVDWDRGLNEREERFRSDLASAFRQPRFDVPANGFKLRRDDGSALTDIDCLVLDRRTGRVALVQLKWHDVYGFSLAERESRRRNLLKANEWVDRILGWVGGRDSAAVASALGIQGGGNGVAPVVHVVTRYAARFVGDEVPDARASWMGWYEILHALDSVQFDDPLAEIPGWLAGRVAALGDIGDFDFQYEFPGLVVDLRPWGAPPLDSMPT